MVFFVDLLRGPSHVDAWRGGMRSLSDAEVHSDSATIDLLVAHRLLGSFGVFRGLVIDETESTGTTGLRMGTQLKLEQCIGFPRRTKLN